MGNCSCISAKKSKRNQIIPQSYFIPTKKIALIFGNSGYAELREKEHFGGFKDLEEVKQDVKDFKTGLRKFGFGARDIKCYENVDYE